MKDLATVYKDRIALEFADEFELALLNAALNNLAKADLLLRVNNFAFALSELIRHVLQNSSPDEKVSACDWFKADPTSLSGITQTHRVKYALQGGLSDIYVRKLGLEDIDEEIKGLLEMIDHLNGYKRIETNRTFLSDAEVETLAIECLEATLGIVEKISETRHQVQKLVAGQME